jgi:hypothetical protein
MRRALAVLLTFASIGCAEAVDDGLPASTDADAGTAVPTIAPPPLGTAQVRGLLAGDAWDTDDARVFARRTTALQIVITLGAASCASSVGARHVTIDLGAAAAGTYAVVPGHPAVEKLRGNEARVRACPPNASTSTGRECDREVLSGTIRLTHADDASPGSVEGTFQVRFADGRLWGSFSAPRCS